MQQPEQETLMTFPCSFPFKVMGLNTSTFEESMLQIIKKHIPSLDASNKYQKPSKNGKYIALTVTFIADSKEQLDNLYREITAHPEVRMVL